MSKKITGRPLKKLGRKAGPENNGYKPVPPLKVVEAMIAMGATHKEVAKVLGVTPSQFMVWQRSLPELKLAQKKGKKLCDERVVHSLYEQAMKGNIVACIFWLKNRQPNEWRDRREFTGTMKVSDPTPDEFRRATDAELDAIIGSRGMWLLRKQGGETPAGNGNGES